jgi:hypothetical protein
MDLSLLNPIATRIAQASQAVYAKYGRCTETLELCASLTAGLAALNATDGIDTPVQPDTGGTNKGDN